MRYESLRNIAMHLKYSNSLKMHLLFSSSHTHFSSAYFVMCYSVVNPCGYWTSGTLSALVSNRNTLYNVMGVKRHVMPVDLPQSVSIRGAEINPTVRAVSSDV